MEVVLTVWGDKAKEDEAQWQNGPVLGVKKCKVSDFNGVSLSTLGSSQLIFEPEVSAKLLSYFLAVAVASFQRNRTKWHCICILKGVVAAFG
jgi:ssDNA-binding replication factor A large subunit